MMQITNEERLGAPGATRPKVGSPPGKIAISALAMQKGQDPDQAGIRISFVSVSRSERGDRRAPRTGPVDNIHQPGCALP